MGVIERKEREKQELKQQILDAARELFVRDGYENVSMRKIADKIEYSPASIYTYFKDKDEILDCLCEETFFKLHQKQMAARQETTGDTLEELRKGMETYIRFGLDHPEDYIVTFILRRARQEQPTSPEWSLKKVSSHRVSTRKAKTGQMCFDGLRNKVRRCMEEGKIKNADVEETSQVLWAGIHGLTALLITQPGFPFVERQRLIQRMIEILVQGVSVDCK